ncbi:hypothetical protein EJ04DRAFT_295069 [Polyplosphaeria fusca]|uniref:Uncharacterized protein n=1 Tax=Polyplosphaeria fusca TaxID=682080 RepID=A0A9P4UYE4_9PLEO|nr:hypothetical protein EJ04DRAFT_295069 [Polyplosphaeria fusca]
MSAPNSDQPTPQSTWDEERCKSALASLERLQTQLDTLRLVMPRIVEPLNSGSTDRAALFAAFAKGTIGSQRDIKEFRATWQSQEVQSVFEHARASLEKDDDLSAGAEVAQFGWVDAVEKERERSKRREKGGQPEEVKAKLDAEEIRRVLEEWKVGVEGKGFAISTKEEDREILVSFVAGGMRLKFRIVVEEEGKRIGVECLGKGSPFTSIGKCVTSRPRDDDLAYLLDMLAAYRTVKGNSCAKCGKMLDEATMMTTARRSRQTANADGSSGTIWEAFHEGCLE